MSNWSHMLKTLVGRRRLEKVEKYQITTQLDCTDCQSMASLTLLDLLRLGWYPRQTSLRDNFMYRKIITKNDYYSPVIANNDYLKDNVSSRHPSHQKRLQYVAEHPEEGADISSKCTNSRRTWFVIESKYGQKKEYADKENGPLDAARWMPLFTNGIKKWYLKKTW